MKIPKHFKLKAEHPHSYEIVDTRDRKSFHVAKHALDLDAHGKLSKIQRFDEGGEVQDSGDAPAPAPVTVNVNTPAPTAAPAEAPAPPPPAAPIIPQEGPMSVQPELTPAEGPMSRAPAAAAVPPTPPAPPSLASQYQGAEGLSERGLRGIQKAEGAQALQDAQAIQANNDRVAAAQSRWEDTAKGLDKEYNDLRGQVEAQNIDPNHWFASKSTAGKISTAIGLILGGLGAGLQHSNTNQALEVVKKQIENDVEAQKANLGKKQTLLSMNLQRYKDLQSATTATINQYNAMLEGALKLNAARQGTARAQANADYAIGQLRAKHVLELPTLAQKDYAAQMLHESTGATPPPTAAGQILREQRPNVPPAGQQSNAGPGGPDVLAEAKVASGQQVARDPSRYGFGVNENKLTAQKVLGYLDKEDGAAATKEYGSYLKLQRELREADEVFDKASQNATYRGRIMRAINPHAFAAAGAAAGAIAGGTAGSIVPVAGTAAGVAGGTAAGGALGEGVGQGIKHLIAAGDEHTKRYESTVGTFLDRLTKDTTGRVTEISMDNLRKAMPEAGDSDETLASKREDLRKMIATAYSFPTLKEYRLVHPNDPLVK